MPRYGWWGWSAETDLDNEDDRANVFHITITEDGEEYAVITHRTCPDSEGVEKYPLSGPVAARKVVDAQHIVDALNAYEGVQ